MTGRVTRIGSRAAGIGAAGSGTAARRVLPAAAGALLALLPAAMAQPAAAGERAGQVTFRGVPIAVPAGWRVVDLTRDPTACVRYDRHALYLGAAGTRQDCPAGIVGREATLQVEGMSRPPSRTQVTESAGSIVATLRAPALRLTLTYGSDRAAAVAQLSALGHNWGLQPLVPARAAAAPLADLSGPAPDARVRTYRGRGFDACTAPSNGTMDVWRHAYRAIGVYIGGVNRGCSQPNLTSSWVTYQHSRGWHLLPLYVGRQAPCWGHSGFLVPLTGAKAAGRTDAGDAVRQAKSLGMGRGTPIYLDLEGYSGNSACSAAVVKYVSGWSVGLRGAGYVAGFYSSGASGIRDVAKAYHSSTYHRPDAIWIGRWNGRPTLFGDPDVPDSYWSHHRRAHQYRGGKTETHGGITINIDLDVLDAPVS